MAANPSANSSETAESDPETGGKASGSRSSSLAVLALLAALIALGLAGWTGFRQLQIDDLQGQAGTDAGKLAAIERRVGQLAGSLSQQEKLIAEIEASLSEGLGGVEELPARLTQVEQTLAGVTGINPGSRTDWLTAEAIYFMRIANAQVSLAGNAEVAASALTLADEKLRDSGDPSFDPVRQVLSDEIAALRALPVIDRAGIAFRLQSLVVQADKWPFRELAPESFSPDTEPLTDEFGPWDRLVTTIKSVVDGIISIKESETPTVAQLGAAERALVLESIKAELQVARLAFIGGNNDLFSQSLERVEQQINNYLDTDTAPVTAALTTLGELRSVQMPADLPDISGSMGLLLERVGNSEVQ
ncbi:MAG: uroporphyrinogen-III C-methyltransferase [Gammaproteobacteria bacterium]|jgi:uroporphyrin-3 C-methyltransferase|nr:uroporphyrinogen-III C-methyltransferase [Gammaproteobacteria bacterium]MDP6617451.1 uroporphyrinogen-III C-methyltransferase [Gammaproteobacteria bacterium]